MTNKQFDKLLELVNSSIEKTNTNMRESISARDRLQVTLRFLASGETYRSLMYATRIHESTLSRLIPEVLSAICIHLQNIYLVMPKSPEKWLQVALEYEKYWNFPHCCGALDGRHINFRAPRSEGSYYYNYKGSNSIILLGLVDAHYRFIYINVGINGRFSDGGVFRESSLARGLINDKLHFPSPARLPGEATEIPYLIVGDDAFPLLTNLMKPYPHRGLSHDCKIFNYRLSRARRVVENAFGILANRFRILLNPINLSPEKVELITITSVILHNYLTKDISGDHFNNSNDSNAILPQIDKQGGNKSSDKARFIRDELKAYFCTVGAVEWQENSISRHNM